MGGNYPDGVSQADIDRAHIDLEEDLDKLEVQIERSCDLIEDLQEMRGELTEALRECLSHSSEGCATIHHLDCRMLATRKSRRQKAETERRTRGGSMNRFTDIDTQDDLHIDPREHLIEHYGHGSLYTGHYCPTCDEFYACKEKICRLERTIECLPCLTRELLEDTEHFAKEARQFLATALPTDDQTLMWWRALRSEIDGKLKGLGVRAAEVLKRKEEKQP